VGQRATTTRNSGQRGLCGRPRGLTTRHGHRSILACSASPVTLVSSTLHSLVVMSIALPPLHTNAAAALTAHAHHHTSTTGDQPDSETASLLRGPEDTPKPVSLNTLTLNMNAAGGKPEQQGGTSKRARPSATIRNTRAAIFSCTPLTRLSFAHALPLASSSDIRAAGLYMLISILLIFFNKATVSSYQFAAPNVVILSQNVCSLIFLLTCKKCKLIEFHDFSMVRSTHTHSTCAGCEFGASSCVRPLTFPSHPCFFLSSAQLSQDVALGLDVHCVHGVRYDRDEGGQYVRATAAEMSMTSSQCRRACSWAHVFAFGML
jgi:hypothetical protein